MAPDLTVAVVGHVARQLEAHHLTRQLGARLFLDNGELGEIANHRRAWQWAAGQDTDWVLVIQDDAIPIPGMLQHLEAGLATLPLPGLVSLYLGTSYPTQHQRRIRNATLTADREHAAWIESRWLLHGVAVCATTRYAQIIADTLGNPDRVKTSLPYDEQISHWAQNQWMPVYYTWPSLVDHADGPSLVDHPDGLGRQKPRHAWRTGAPNWNNTAVRL